MKRVMMIAYHFPPFAGSSGVERALRFALHLPDFGWQPMVLTVHPRAYETRSDELISCLPESVQVIRAPAWDAKRHFGIAGRHPAFLARPDRWRTWWLSAVPVGFAAIRRYQPDVLWSTYPIATAHAIGATLAKLCHVPWLADFRDPMAQENYPSDPTIRRSLARIERLTVSRARCTTLTTPGALHQYQGRYPSFSASFKLLENGYDEDTFARSTDQGPALNPGRLTLLHSGVVYPSERDPTQLFAAIANLRARVPAVFDRLLLRFRSPTYGPLLRELANRYEVESAVEILPSISHREAVAEMRRADGLLILQARNCDAQIPAKFYEYLRARRPIVVLAGGDTADAARAAGTTAIARLDDVEAITGLLEEFVVSPESGTLPSEAAVAKASRYARTAELADLLTQVAVY